MKKTWMKGLELCQLLFVTCVPISYFLHSGVFLFLQNCLLVPGYPKISYFGYPVPEMTENAQPYA